MKSTPLWLAMGLALVLMVVVVVVAAELPSAEADLTPLGGGSEVNRGPDGTLYVSEDRAGKVWLIQPSGVYASYSIDNSPLDAQPDSNGDIWWTDGATILGRINVAEGSQTTWDVGLDHNWWGLAIDGSDTVWITDWSSTTGPKLYGFDPQATELCTYTLPGGTYSRYLVEQSGKLWLGNRFFDRITRFDPLANQVTWWELTDSASWPLGLAVDGQGDVWWADPGLGALGRLDPGSGQMTRYDLPAAAGPEPQMVEVRGSRVWFTGGVSGTIGVLDPQSAQGQTSTLVSGSSDLSPSCGTLGAGATTALVATETGTLTWTPGSLAPSHQADGWTVYELPTSAEPYGLADGSGYLWVSDPGRDSLHRFEQPQYLVFLPVVSRR